MRHGLQRPPMYGEPGGLQGEVTLAELLSDAGYVTQAVGKWHLGENVESQPQNVGFDDFYGFLSVSDMYSEWRDPHFFPEVVYSEARTEWVKNMPFNKCFVHAERGGEVETVEEVRPSRSLSLLDEKWCTYTEEFVRRMAGGDQPWFCYLGTRGAHFDNYPHERFLGLVTGEAPLQGHDHRARRHRRATGRRARGDRAGRGHADLPVLGQRPAHGELARRRLHPVPVGQGLDLGGRRAGARASLVWPGMIEADRASDGLFSFTDLLPTMLALAGAERPHPRRPVHRRRRPDLVPARRRTACRTGSTSGTGC